MTFRENVGSLEVKSLSGEQIASEISQGTSYFLKIDLGLFLIQGKMLLGDQPITNCNYMSALFSSLNADVHEGDFMWLLKS